eukprot:c26939_g1_i1 orf=525-1751(-)
MDHTPAEREPSPDWLRTFQAPLKDFSTLSSSSPSSSSHDATLVEAREGSSVKTGDQKETGRQHTSGFVNDIVDLYSDSDKDEETKIFSTRSRPTKKKILHENGQEEEELPILQFQKQKGPKRKLEHVPETQRLKIDERMGNLGETVKEEDDDKADIKTMFPDSKSKKHDMMLQEDDTEGQERRAKRVPSTLPLVVGDKVHRSKVLLECEGDALDLSGDVGAVGRFSVSALYEKDVDVLLDLKGVIYKAKIVPSNTFFVVSIGQSEAKVEALMSDFVQLQPNVNIYETETMVEGTLEGFSFDSDDDGGHVVAAMTTVEKDDDESEDGEAPPKKKIKFDNSLKNKVGHPKKTVKAGTPKVGAKGGSTRKSHSIGKLPKKVARKSPKKAAGKSPKKSTISKKTKLMKKLGK